MATRRQRILDLAILGALNRQRAHGYEIRKELNIRLGTFRTLSYGSLYPALRSLTERGFITAVDETGKGKRSKIVYDITEAGREELARCLNTAAPESWDDEQFDVRFAMFADTDAATRLVILEGRRNRLAEHLTQLRASIARASEVMDNYTAELARHGLEQAENELQWLEKVIDTERGTQGALAYGRPDAPSGISPHPTGEPASTAQQHSLRKEHL